MTAMERVRADLRRIETEMSSSQVRLAECLARKSRFLPESAGATPTAATTSSAARAAHESPAPLCSN